ncbi:MAG: DNA alkylation repair protein [Ignavibacteria bacterium]|nr:DNA alkylation repair protein [Ignavibacteria bacterium]
MTYQQTMATLRKLGTVQNIKVYKRHGAGDNFFGVSFANLNKLKKKFKIDHDLALQLWKTGNTDAQTLATMIADPERMSEPALDKWLKDIHYYLLVDVFVGNVVSKSKFAKSRMELWTKSEDEWVGRAGWHLLAQLAMRGDSLGDSYFEKYLESVKRNIHQSKNRTKDAMNNALIAIGIRNATLEKKAIEAANLIGKVNVDHGETGCKTPDAAAYIKKARARKKSQTKN